MLFGQHRKKQAARKAAEQSAADLQLLRQQRRPHALEMTVCAYYYKLLSEYGASVKPLRFQQDEMGFVDVVYHDTRMQFRVAPNGGYLIINSKYMDPVPLIVKPCPSWEAPSSHVRVFFRDFRDLRYMDSAFIRACAEKWDYFGFHSEWLEVEYPKGSYYAPMTELTEAEALHLLQKSPFNE